MAGIVRDKPLLRMPRARFHRQIRRRELRAPPVFVAVSANRRRRVGAMEIHNEVDRMVEIRVAFRESEAALVERRVRPGACADLLRTALLHASVNVVDDGFQQRRNRKRLHDQAVGVLAQMGAVRVRAARRGSVGVAVSRLVDPAAARSVDVPERRSAHEELVIDDVVDAVPVDGAVGGLRAHAAADRGELSRPRYVVMRPGDGRRDALVQFGNARRLRRRSRVPAPCRPEIAAHGMIDESILPPHGDRTYVAPVFEASGCGRAPERGAAHARVNERGLFAGMAVSVRKMPAEPVDHERQTPLRPVPVHERTASFGMRRHNALPPVVARGLARIGNPVIAGSALFRMPDLKCRFRERRIRHLAELQILRRSCASGRDERKCAACRQEKGSLHCPFPLVCYQVEAAR